MTFRIYVSEKTRKAINIAAINGEMVQNEAIQHLLERGIERHVATPFNFKRHRPKRRNGSKKRDEPFVNFAYTDDFNEKILSIKIVANEVATGGGTITKSDVFRTFLEYATNTQDDDSNTDATKGADTADRKTAPVPK